MIPALARPLALFLLAAIGLGAAVASASTPTTLPPRLQQVMMAEGIPATAVSIVVREASTGDTLLELNAATSRSPASTMKVLTTWSSLEALGPNHHWHTRAYATAAVRNGRLNGDLILVGGGDPGLTAEHWWRFARVLRATGLQTIDGDIVIDRSLYKTQSEDPDEFDGKGYRAYNVLPDPLLVNLQSAEFHVHAENGEARLLVDPSPANLHVDNRVHATTQGCPQDGRLLRFTTIDADPLHVAIDGAIGPTCPGYAQRSIMTAPEYAFGTFISFWRSLGGRFDGSLRLAPRPEQSTLVAELESDSLAEVVRNTNKWSSNAMARMLLLSLAAERFGAPVGAQDGERALLDFLESRGLLMPELVVDNGSGLSRQARISADSLSHTLHAAYHGRYFPEFIASLPIGGQDGTLRKRFVDLASEAHIRMKTGHLAGVAAIAGYATTRGGRLLTVVVMVNAPGAESGRGDAIVDTVVRWALDRR
ncbi:MAG: D-alanyl-D-alanine carboxypeptidase/D-alanyl-D-alanine-endopeptidase [Pseudomonadota bacterium]|jgi:D-alanyl-D-alanine carboxypeptidase/D-alanyl-D-alanine-endopeptidase (penicillin-binding protein 4)